MNQFCQCKPIHSAKGTLLTSILKSIRVIIEVEVLVHMPSAELNKSKLLHYLDIREKDPRTSLLVEIIKDFHTVEHFMDF